MKKQIHYLICASLLFSNSIPLVKAQKVEKNNLVHEIAKHYLGSFEVEKPKEKTAEELEKERKRQVYEVDRPDLSQRQVTDILLTKVYTNNLALSDYLQAKQDSIAVMPTIVWESIKLFQGPASAPGKHMLAECMRPHASQIEKIAMAVKLTTPITDIEKLQQEKAITEEIAGNLNLLQSLKSLFDQLINTEKSLLALYRKSEDPLFSKSYQKLLTQLFHSTEGKFTNWFIIELSKRWTFEISILLLIPFILTLCLIVVGINILAHLEILDDEYNSFLRDFGIGSAIYTLFMILFMVYPIIIVYKTFRAVNDYIAGRLGDVQTLFEVAEGIDTIVRKNPILAAHCANKLKHTRKLLSKTHENQAYNQLTDRFLNCDFKNWSLFFNSTATLLTTFTLLEENLHVLDAMIFEIGQIGTYLSGAYLLHNPNNYKNGFAYAELIDQMDAYVQLQGAWNTAIPAKKAVANDLLVSANKTNTAAIMGPNACGKSQVIQMVLKIAILSQAGLPIPVVQGTITPFHAFYAFKEPQEDPNIQKSLFARELDYINHHNAILKQCNSLDQKSLTLYDEFLTSTNPTEASALQVAIISYNMHKYANNINIISTHNPYLIDNLLNNKKAQVLHVVIDRHADGSYTPTYKIAYGPTDEKVGIDLFLKATGNEKIAEDARKVVKKIEANQKKTK